MAPLLSASDWLQWLLHFMLLSLLAVGGAITTAPDMHRYVVLEHRWISHAEFTSSIALSQAAPGPNVLFVALVGWHVGVNAGGGLPAAPGSWAWGVLGAVACMGAIMLPSSVMAFAVVRWAHRYRERRGVKAFKQGLAPIVIALLASTGCLLLLGQQTTGPEVRPWLLCGVVTLLAWRTRLHLLWLLGAGAALGALGWV